MQSYHGVWDSFGGVYDGATGRTADVLISYDIGLDLKMLHDLERVKGRTNFQYRQGNTRLINIEYTDFLLIDTLHTYEQLATELTRHRDKVQKYLAFHDTTGFRFVDEIQTNTDKKGLWPANC